jgi:hypothetical protein
MDLDRLPHFGRSSFGGAPQPPPQPPPRAPSVQLADAHRGDPFRGLEFPHAPGRPEPSYREELREATSLLGRGLGQCSSGGGSP